MKSKKEKFYDNLAEGVIELILSIVFLGVGIIIYSIIGLFFNVSEIEENNPDTFILIGVVAFFAVFFIVGSLVKFIKNRKRKVKLDKAEK